jgi:hypothetical protein
VPFVAQAERGKESAAASAQLPFFVAFYGRRARIEDKAPLPQPWLAEKVVAVRIRRFLCGFEPGTASARKTDTEHSGMIADR